jgi:hypothetical protein
MVPTIFFKLPLPILLLFALIVVIVLFLKIFVKKPWIVAIAALVMLSIVGIVYLKPGHRRVIINHEVSSESVLSPDENIRAAIWSPGIEDEFEADVYPSKVSAVRSLGLRMARPVQKVIADQSSPKRIILLEGDYDRQLLQDFGKAVAKVFPEIPWFIKDKWSEMKSDEVWMKLEFADTQARSAQWQSSYGSVITSGRIEATAMTKSKASTINAKFVEKPWVDNFSGFLNNQPDGRFIIAKSSESCLTESEANNQAMENACNQVAEMLRQTSNRLSSARSDLLSKVNSNDILEGGLILDRFVQSFEGAAGKIWRQALLIDASTEKLTQLARRKADMVRARKMSLARTFFSIAGLLVLITMVYLFLNAATKGYYVWSLRIAGFVLALILIFLLLA